MPAPKSPSLLGLHHCVSNALHAADRVNCAVHYIATDYPDDNVDLTLSMAEDNLANALTELRALRAARAAAKVRPAPTTEGA